MSLHDARLKKARALVALDPRRPRQVMLRGAVADAYYALFHLLIDASVANSVGRGAPSLSHAMARWYDHGTMKTVAARFRGATTTKDLGAGYGAEPVPAELARVAGTFMDLQEERHRADYDPARMYTRTGALALVQRAEQAFHDWQHVAADPVARLFLLCLLGGLKLPQR